MFVSYLICGEIKTERESKECSLYDLDDFDSVNESWVSTQYHLKRDWDEKDVSEDD